MSIQNTKAFRSIIMLPSNLPITSINYVTHAGVGRTFFCNVTPVICRWEVVEHQLLGCDTFLQSKITETSFCLRNLLFNKPSLYILLHPLLKVLLFFLRQKNKQNIYICIFLKEVCFIVCNYQEGATQCNKVMCYPGVTRKRGGLKNDKF